MSQTLDGVIDGLLAAATAAFSNPYNGQAVLVCEGDPPSYQPDLIVAVAWDVRQTISRPTMGSGRSRERTAEIDVLISAYVAGSDASTRIARTQCNGLTDQFEAYLRTAPHEILSGACRDSWVSSISGPSSDKVLHPQSGHVTGVVAASILTVTVPIRY